MPIKLESVVIVESCSIFCGYIEGPDTFWFVTVFCCVIGCSWEAYVLILFLLRCLVGLQIGLHLYHLGVVVLFLNCHYQCLKIILEDVYDLLKDVPECSVLECSSRRTCSR